MLSSNKKRTIIALALANGLVVGSVFAASAAPVAAPAAPAAQAAVADSAAIPSSVSQRAALPPASLPPLPPTAGNGSYVAPPVPASVINDEDEEQVSFDDILEKTLVLNPAQIRETRRQATARIRAAQELPSEPPRPVTSMISASPTPGSTPPVLRLFPGYATSIYLTDASGAPWPIENWAVGHKDNFEIKRMDGPKGSILSVVPMQYYGSSNLILSMKGLSSPIVLQFISGQKEVDFRADVRVQAKGPNTQLSVAGLPQSTNAQLLSVLEGVAPQGAKPLLVGMPDASAWVSKTGRMYLKTTLPIISPAWLGSVRASDGSSAYEMMPTTNVLVLKDGQIRSVTVEGW